MAKFQDYFKIVEPKPSTMSMTDSASVGDQGAYANFTWYQRLVQGSRSRLTRYREYDLMDNDVEVNRALDTIAEQMTGVTPSDDLPFELIVDNQKEKTISPNAVMTLKTALRYWCDLHDWNTRMFFVARNAVKYGDLFFLRHSDTRKWEYIHPKNVISAIVDEHDITNVLAWQVKRDVKRANSPYSAQVGGYGYVATDQTETIPASQIVWISLNTDLGEDAPFGTSILKAVYRAQKQKELLEDAIIIYRIQRAPERRVFYIDVGKMPPQRVKAYLEQIKNEIRQRRIPSFGGGKNEIDSAYNPQSMNEDFFFAQHPDGRGSKVETLPAGQNLGQLEDLEYFQDKVFRGLRVPISYMKWVDGGIFNDGKSGVAFFQELQFANFIARQQKYINSPLDREFKRYIRQADINIDPSYFKIRLPLPENFGTYRKQQLDNDLLNTLSTANGIEYLSARFKLREYAQLTDTQIAVNESLKREELGIPDDMPRDEALKLIYGGARAQQEGGMFGGGTSGFIPPPMGGAPADLGGDIGPLGAGDLGAETAMGAQEIGTEMGGGVGANEPAGGELITPPPV